MKTISRLFVVLVLLSASISCHKKSTDLTPVDPTPSYQKAIDARYKAVAWTQVADNAGKAVPTKGGKGYVVYYGNKDRAIYYFNGTAFAVLRY